MSPFQLELNSQGYLIFPLEIFQKYFTQDSCVAIWKNPELWILPIYDANGGFLVKQRNAKGDRSILVWEVLPLDFPTGMFTAFWDAENAAVRIALKNE